MSLVWRWCVVETVRIWNQTLSWRRPSKRCRPTTSKNLASGNTSRSTRSRNTRRVVKSEKCISSQNSFNSDVVDFLLDIVTPVTHLLGRAELRAAQNGENNIPHAFTGFGRHSFPVAGPDSWNRLPRVIRCIVVPSTFKRHGLTFLLISLMTRRSLVLKV